jgi:hypothetical protein
MSQSEQIRLSFRTTGFVFVDYECCISLRSLNLNNPHPKKMRLRQVSNGFPVNKCQVFEMVQFWLPTCEPIGS